MGDVWLCGGQSNMGLPLRFTKNADEEIEAADYPDIRFFTVGGHPASHQVGVIDGNWRVVSPDTANWISAVGYYLARKVQQPIHVPVGLMVDAVGGTPPKPGPAPRRSVRSTMEWMAAASELEPGGRPSTLRCSCSHFKSN